MVVVVDERKELECGGELDKSVAGKRGTIVLKELLFSSTARIDEP